VAIYQSPLDSPPTKRQQGKHQDSISF